MPYDLSVEREKGYIRVDLFDPFTQSDIDSAMKEVQEIRQEQKINRILCDQRELQVPPSAMAGFFTAEQFGKPPLVGTKLALLRKRAREESLFEIAAQTRGLIVSVFMDEEEAIQWLLTK
jgi:hypothetical protein